VSTNSIHLWVLEVRSTVDAAGTPGCAELVLGDAEPYDAAFDRLADFVVIDGHTGTAEDVPRRAVLVYVEAIDFRGRTQLAGCVALASVTEPVSVMLRTPGTYDCADPGAAEGAPCDDSMFCTVGETCSGGTCRGGGPPDCSSVADQCNSAACSEDVGCHGQPLTNGRPCEDGDYCSAGDSCQDGVCASGGPRDCSALDATCRRGVCNEATNQCQSQIDSTLACDDARYCTVVDSCNGSGVCGGSIKSCAAAADACNSAVCSEALLGGCARTPINQSGTCTTNCVSGGMCNSGACTGGTALPPGTEGPAGSTTCSDYLDNDCDGLFDASDPNCQA